MSRASTATRTQQPGSGAGGDPTRRRIVRAPLGSTGLAGATLLFCLCLTPSLLPRSWVVQGVACGVTAAIGYGIGATVGWICRRVFPTLSPRLRRWTRWVVAASAVAMIATFLAVSGGWQASARRLLGMADESAWPVVPILVVAVLVLGVLVFLARVVRLVGRRVRRWLGRFVPLPVATVVAVAFAALLVVMVLDGVLFRGFISLANQAASLTNTDTSQGTVQPTSTYLSGGPDSLVPWDTLGSQGRDFTGRAPTREQIAAFTGGPAADPIRAYIGLDSAGSLDEQVQLAVRELDRTGAWDRSVLAVLATTGTGWVDERVASSLEYLHRGDTAEVALQYSFLPSWISFMVDRDKAAAAGEALIRAVQQRWSQLPADGRPRLLVFGESLGSYGTESAFGQLDKLVTSTDGALLVGPVNLNPVWSEVVAGRQPGSPQWLPVFQDGRTVRFADTPDDLGSPGTSLSPPQVVYLQNSSDPVVWWSPHLLFNPPQWLAGERGRDVPVDMNWYPVVTFWQVMLDLVFANSVPEGHGHLYGADVVDGWVAVHAPSGWSDADTQRLRALVIERSP